MAKLGHTGTSPSVGAKVLRVERGWGVKSIICRENEG